jgi:hypothetical protein
LNREGIRLPGEEFSGMLEASPYNVGPSFE